MKCACGNEEAAYVRVFFDQKTGQKTHEICDKCGNVDIPVLSDVYFKEPYFDEHLADKDHKHGRWVYSKRQKAQIMKEQGLREAGSDVNPVLGRPQPHISDVDKRRKFYKDNFGG